MLVVNTSASLLGENVKHHPGLFDKQMSNA